ncbi:hypothetical protein NIES21_14590 [Anabaenopsis circularis NIES-21]|uniref:Replication origin-binding protein domain-containing protein n=1 Tax=Anabaenopsis circularis NIES-21 TaxID=1085406 RepID=A0A1Z4GDP4_9CYAN|nr:hypothetical protein NIES21_14590 [Anabaenopsis circularis NIES-21]
MNYRIEKNNELQPSSYFNFNTASTLDSVKISVHPITGRQAALIQLEKHGYKVGDEFWVKVNNNIPVKCRVTKDGFTAQACEKRLDESNNAIKDPKGGSVWDTKGGIWNDGYNYILKQTQKGKDAFIIPNHCQGGISANHATKFQLIFFEVDDRSIDEQWKLLNELANNYGIVPYMVVFSGGKSLHVYYKLNREISPETWQRLQRKCIILFKSDRSIQNPNREMRFSGFPRGSNNSEQTLDFVSDYEYSPEDFEASLDASGKFPHGLSPDRWHEWKGKSGKGELALTMSDEEFYRQKTPSKRKDSSDEINSIELEDYDGPIKPLEAYLRSDDRYYLLNGIGEGERNSIGFTLACGLLGAAAALKRLGINFIGDPYKSLCDYCDRCSPTLDDCERDQVWASADSRERESALPDESLIAIATGQRFKNNDFEPINLNKLTIRPGWHHITDCYVQTEFGLKYNPEVLAKIPSEAILILKAPMGAGKTELINVLINELYKNSQVVSLTPTIALNKGLGERLKIETRNEMESLGVNPAFSSRIGVVCPSLHKLLGRSYHGHNIALFDEKRQSSNFLFQARECDTYSPRSQKIRALNEVCKNSDIIVVSDAYITDVEVDYVTNLRPDLPVYVLEISTYAREREIWEITKESKIYELIDQFLKEGKNVIIPCDSQKIGEALDEVYNTRSIEEIYQKKGYKTFRLDRETKGDQEQTLFLKNPTEYIKNNPEIRLFIYSPTLGSGASIEAKHFDVMIAINTHLPSTDFLQLIGRYRPQIPLYYWASGDKPKKNNWSTSHYPTAHKKSFFDTTDRLKEMLEIAVAEASGCHLISATDKLSQMAREGMEGQSPGLDLICNQRARHNYLTSKRRDKLREQFFSDGFNVNSLDEEEYRVINGTPNELVEEKKAFLRQKKAINVIKAPLVSEAEGKKLLNKKVLTPQERHKVDKYKFNEKLPGFLDSLTEDEAIAFYCNYLKDDGHWIKSVFARWRWENRDLVTVKEIKSLERRLESFELSGVDSPGDLDRLRSPYFKFLEEVGFFNEFALGNVFTLKTIIRWAFKLNSEADIEELLAYSSLKDKESTKTQRDAIANKYIKLLPAIYKREMSQYLRINLSGTPSKIKYLVRRVGDVLRRFGLDTSKKGGGDELRIYQVVEGDNVLQKDYRNRLETIISEKSTKPGCSKAVIPMVEAKNERQINPPLSIIPVSDICRRLKPYTEGVSLSNAPGFEQPFENVLQAHTNPPPDAAIYPDLINRDSLKRIAGALTRCVTIDMVKNLFEVYLEPALREAVNHVPQARREQVEKWLDRIRWDGQQWRVLPPPFPSFLLNRLQNKPLNHQEEASKPASAPITINPFLPPPRPHQ